MKALTEQHIARASECPVVLESSMRLANSQTHLEAIKARHKKMVESLNRLEARRQDLTFQLQNNRAKEAIRIEAILNEEEPGIDDEACRIQDQITQIDLDIAALKKAKEEIERDIKYKEPLLATTRKQLIDAVYDALARRMYSEAQHFISEYIKPMQEVRLAASYSTRGDLNSLCMKQNDASLRVIMKESEGKDMYMIQLGGDVPSLPRFELSEGSSFLDELADGLNKVAREQAA